jgi:HAMP domain-containing protein
MYLTASHAVALVRAQTELTMSNLAVTVLSSVVSQPEALPADQERFLQTMVNSRLEGRVSSVEIVYALLQDSHGAVMALAADEPALAQLRWPLSGDRGQKIDALQRLSDDSALAARHGLIVVQASLEAGQPSLAVTLGCRRQAAGYVSSQIIARHAAVGVVIVLTALLSLWIALGRMTQPIRRVFQVVNQVSQGRLNFPIFARQADEVGQVTDAVDQIRQALARGRQWQDTALGMLSTCALDPNRLPPEAVCLRLPLAPLAATEGALAELVECLLAHEGTLEGAAGGTLVATWGRRGAEQDDLLRAVVAGLEVSAEVLRLTGAPLWPSLSLGPETGGQSAPAPVPGGPAVAVLVEAAAREALAPALEAGDFLEVGEREGVWQAISWRLEEDPRLD